MLDKADNSMLKFDNKRFYFWQVSLGDLIKITGLEYSPKSCIMKIKEVSEQLRLEFDITKRDLKLLIKKSMAGK